MKILFFPVLVTIIYHKQNEPHHRVQTKELKILRDDKIAIKSKVLKILSNCEFWFQHANENDCLAYRWGRVCQNYLPSRRHIRTRVGTTLLIHIHLDDKAEFSKDVLYIRKGRRHIMQAEPILSCKNNHFFLSEITGHGNKANVCRRSSYRACKSEANDIRFSVLISNIIFWFCAVSLCRCLQGCFSLPFANSKMTSE